MSYDTGPSRDIPRQESSRTAIHAPQDRVSSENRERPTTPLGRMDFDAKALG